MTQKSVWILGYTGVSRDEMQKLFVEKRPIVNAEDDIQSPAPNVVKLFEKNNIEFTGGSITYGKVFVRGLADDVEKLGPEIGAIDALCEETGTHITF